MKLHIFSDLHFDADRDTWRPKLADGADIVVCAGDVCEGLGEGVRFLSGCFRDTPIVTVPGNHSFYRRCLPDETQAGLEAAAECGVDLLIDRVVEYGDVRFVGATLWTDYELYGEANRLGAIHTARSGLNDHRLIKWQNNPWQRFRPEEAIFLHRRSRLFLEEELSKPWSGSTVVVTHHAPHLLSIHPKYEGQLLNAAYASDLESLILDHEPDLWIHGHVHSSFDYHVGATRIVCNPHGYGRENASGFRPDFVVDV